MSRVIENRVGMVFIPVANMQRSVAWYSAVFQVPAGQLSHEDRIYGLPMQGEVSVLLDAHAPVSNSSQPLCLFWCDDIQATQRHLLALDVPIVQDISDIGSLFTISFSDPDGNLLMVAQRK